MGHRRENSNPGQVDRKIGQAPAGRAAEHEPSPTPNLESPVNVKLIDRQPVTVAYLRHLGPYGEPISRFWQDTYVPWAVTNNLMDRPRYGISHDDPGITSPESCRYDACAQLPAEFVVTGGAFKTTLPGGRYAALAFQGSAAGVVEGWTSLLRDWLPASGLQLDARPCFEHYPVDAECDPQTDAFSCEICISVVPL